MKRLCTILFSGLVALAGCNTHTTENTGGPGATNTDTRRGPDVKLTQGENTFSLDAPHLATSVKQGETKTVRLGITRGKNFDQDVKLDISGQPQGVKITPSNAEIRAADKEVQLTIDASKEAALGDHTITVKGVPNKDGKAATTTFRVKVDKAG